MKLRTVRRVTVSLLAISMIMCFICIKIIPESQETLMVVMAIFVFVSLVAAAIIHIVFCRCPHCEHYLNFILGIGVKNCPYCGNDLPW